MLESQSNDILTGVVACMQKTQPSERVRQVATQALLNSLEFCDANFAREGERHVIMQVRINLDSTSLALLLLFILIGGNDDMI